MENEAKKEQLIKRFQGMGIEIGGGVATDVATTPLLGMGPLGWLGYGAINFGQGAYTNYLVQKHLYGEDELNWGEILASGAAGAIPFMNIGASKGVAKVVGKAGSVQRGLVGGALTGIGTEQVRVGIDDNRLLTPQELAFAGGFGGVFGAGFTKLGQLSKRPKINPAKTYPDALFVDPALDDLMRQRTGLGMKLLNRIDGDGSDITPKVDRFNYGEDVLANVPDKTKKLLKDNGFTDNESILLVANFDKPIPRDLSAAIESIYNTVEDFDNFKKTMLPVYLESMKKLRRNKTPQADHIAQLRAALPFFYNKPVKLWPQISDIIVKEGVFALGHNNKNLKYLEFDVHAVKTAFWKSQVGDAGEKFFQGRPLDTPDQIKAAAKEFSAFIRRSNKIVNDAIEQYNFMNQIDISEDELVEYVNRLGSGPIDRSVSIKQVKEIFDQMAEDGWVQSTKASQKAETQEIKVEQKTAETKAKKQKQLTKDNTSVKKAQDILGKLDENLDTFDVNPYPFGMKDEALREKVEKAYEELQKYKLTLGPQQQKLEIFELEDKEAWIKNRMRLILDKIKARIRNSKKNKKK